MQLFLKPGKGWKHHLCMGPNPVYKAHLWCEAYPEMVFVVNSQTLAELRAPRLWQQHASHPCLHRNLSWKDKDSHGSGTFLVGLYIGTATLRSTLLTSTHVEDTAPLSPTPLTSPLSQATVMQEAGPGTLWLWASSESAWNSVFPTVKWGQSSCSAVPIGLLRGFEGASVNPCRGEGCWEVVSQFTSHTRHWALSGSPSLS